MGRAKIKNKNEFSAGLGGWKTGGGGEVFCSSSSFFSFFFGVLCFIFFRRFADSNVYRGGGGAVKGEICGKPPFSWFFAWLCAGFYIASTHQNGGFV